MMTTPEDPALPEAFVPPPPCPPWPVLAGRAEGVPPYVLPPLPPAAYVVDTPAKEVVAPAPPVGLLPAEP